MKQWRRLRLGYNPEKTRNITMCLFPEEQTYVKLRCTYNIHSDHIGIYQEIGKSWDTLDTGEDRITLRR